MPPLPAVDFGTRMVIVAALGRQTTGGYSITIGGATRESELIVVKIVQQSPGSGCATTAGFTEPVDIAVVPTDDRSVSFEFESRINTCH